MTTATADHSEPESHDAPATVTADKPSYDDINTPVIVLVGVISALVTYITIALVQGMCYHWQNSKIQSRSTEVVEMPAVLYINEQKKALAGGDGVVSIDDAMKKVIDEYGKK